MIRNISKRRGIWGSAAIREGGKTPAERIGFIGRVLLARGFHSDEQAILLAALSKFEAGFANDPQAAGELLSVGESPVDKKVPATEQAAWMMMATTVMNSDEAINK